MGDALDGGFGQAGGLGDDCRGEVGGELEQVVEACGVGVDVGLVDEAVADEDVGDAVEQGDVAARSEGEMDVGHHGGLGDARVGDDEGLVLVALEPLAEDGVVVGEVGADEQDDVGRVEVGVGAGGPVTSRKRVL